MLHKEGQRPGNLGKLCPTQRVLGTLLIYSCSNVVQNQARFRSRQAGWNVVGRFWSAECSQRVKRIIFRSMVWWTLLTEWETLLPSRADCRAFDRFTACKERSFMRGKASGRWIDAEEKETSSAHNDRSFEKADIGSHPP